MIMYNIIIKDNDVNGTPTTLDGGSVASGRSCCGQQQAGRHQTADPGCGTSDRATPASGSTKSSVDQATDRDLRTSGNSGVKPRFQNKRKMFIGDPKPFIRYYIVKSTGEADLTKLNLFKVDSEICRIIGECPKISENTDKTITVEVNSPEQADRLLKIENLLEEPVKIEQHQKYNESQGVITCSILKDYTETDIVEGLAHLGVSKAYRISKRDAAGKPQPTSTLILTFNTPEIPDKIRIRAGLYERVRQYIPLPRRCYKCQNYGHGSKNCRSKDSVCPRCGDICNETHVSESCQRPVKCYHCKENHSTSSRTCNKYLMEKEIITVKTKEKLTFREARQKVSQMFVRPGVTYASVLQHPNKINNNRNSITNKESSNVTRVATDSQTGTSSGITILEHPSDMPDHQSNRPAVSSIDADMDHSESTNHNQNPCSSIKTLQENYKSPPRSIRRRLSYGSPDKEIVETSELKRQKASIPNNNSQKTRNEPVTEQDSFQTQRGTNKELLAHLKYTNKANQSNPSNISKMKSKYETSTKPNNTIPTINTRSTSYDRNKHHKDKDKINKK